MHNAASQCSQPILAHFPAALSIATRRKAKEPSFPPPTERQRKREIKNHNLADNKNGNLELAEIDGLEKVIPTLLAETHIEDEGVAKQGCVRYCKAPEGNIFREKIVKLDNATMYYAYEIIEGVSAKMTNSFKVISLGDNVCKVIWTSDYSFMENPMMKEDQFFAFVNVNGQKITDQVKAYFSI